MVPDWDSLKTGITAPDGIDRADISAVDGVQQTRRTRYRTTTKTTSTERSIAIDSDDSEGGGISTGAGAKLPVYRVRGRNRTKQQNTDNDKSTIGATTVKSIDESVRTVNRRKPYQSKAQRANARNNENPISIESSQKDDGSESSSSTSSHSSRKTTTTELPANHQPENSNNQRANGQNARKTPTGRRYRVRVSDANSLNQANGPSSSPSTAAAGNSGEFRQTYKSKKSDRDPPPIDDEQNYPEHFKALLKAKKSTVSPPPPSAASPSSGINRFNNFVPKKMMHPPMPITTTSTSMSMSVSSSTGTDPSLPTLRPAAYKHKKLERPNNLKILFPSLQQKAASTAATVATLELNTELDIDPTDEINTETATHVVDATSAITTASNRAKPTAAVKPVAGGGAGGGGGATKFSSKIRAQNNDDLSSLSAFRTRSTPLLNFDTLRSSTPYPPSSPSSPTPPSTNHRLTSVSFRHSPSPFFNSLRIYLRNIFI